MRGKCWEDLVNIYDAIYPKKKKNKSNVESTEAVLKKNLDAQSCYFLLIIFLVILKSFSDFNFEILLTVFVSFNSFPDFLFLKNANGGVLY